MPLQTQMQPEDQLELLAEKVVAHEEAIQDAVVRLGARLESSRNLSTAIEYVIELLDGYCFNKETAYIAGNCWWVGHTKTRFYSRKRKVLMCAPKKRGTRPNFL